MFIIKKQIALFLFLLVLACSIVTVVTTVDARQKTLHPATETYISVSEAEYTAHLQSKSAENIVKSGDKLYYGVDNAYYEYATPTENSYMLAGLNGYEIKEVVPSTTNSPLWASILIPIVFMGIALFGFKVFITNAKNKIVAENGSPKINLNKLNSNEIGLATRPKVTFDDVQGCSELKENIKTYINCLKNSQKLKDMGARMPKGIILYGPPGTGKTLIAKAIAGSAGINFISVSASQFVEMYVGVGAKRIRELYAEARKNSPCIVFIDEIDTIGAKRDNMTNSEDNKTINQLLSELDGFVGSEGVFTIATTNRLDSLDSALIRPGRFDLQLAVPLPDKMDRYEILLRHARNKSFEESIDMMNLASKTMGFSGAELESFLNESALLAISNNQTEISKENVDDAFFKIVLKGNKSYSKRDAKEIELVAYHEAGHTLVTKLLTDDGVPSVTIIQSTAGTGGVTFKNPSERTVKSKTYLKNTIMGLYAGRAAEHILLGNDDEITTGASSDIKQATRIIQGYINDYGMGNNGMISISELSGSKNHSIVEEASNLAKTLYDEVYSLLQKNKAALDLLASSLVENESLCESEIDNIIAQCK